jgi:hypothetical protein
VKKLANVSKKLSGRVSRTFGAVVLTVDVEVSGEKYRGSFGSAFDEAQSFSGVADLASLLVQPVRDIDISHIQKAGMKTHASVAVIVIRMREVAALEVRKIELADRARPSS